MAEDDTPETKSKTRKETPTAVMPGCGLDAGTMNFVAARRTGRGVETRRMRDAFIDLPLDSKKMLKLQGVNYVKMDDQLIVVGDAAMEFANLFGKEARRPLQAGMVSAGELDAQKVLGVLIKKVLGDPTVEGEYCYYSVPAAPVDQDRDIVYHKGILAQIIRECGYTPIASNEALAIIYSETAQDGFSGIGCSFGSGMSNIALAINTVEGLSFSVARGGDWIDAGAAKAVGSTGARICSIKEKGVDLMAPEGRDQEALAFYYRAHIDYVLDNFLEQFLKIKNQFSIPKAIPIVVGGGTSLAGGFLELFKETFEAKRKRFPIEISEIRAASEPLNAVAQGLLIQALQEYDEDDDDDE